MVLCTQLYILHVCFAGVCFFDRNKIYENKFGVNGDYYSFFKLLNYGEFANLPLYLLKYRVHEKNYSLQPPKKKFINSLKIRIKAITDLNYQISIKAFILMVIQTIVILLTPEKMIIPLYMHEFRVIRMNKQVVF